MPIRHMELHHCPLVRSSRVRWLLHELGLDNFTLKRINLFEGTQYRQDYLDLNPNHGVPVLVVTFETGETCTLFESGAIIQFLADCYPERGLAPPSFSMSAERALYLRTLYFGAATVDMILWQIRIHEYILPADARDARTIARYRQKFTNEIEPQLANLLARHDYICGDDFSAADCLFGHCVGWAKRHDMCNAEVFDRYRERISSRPAFVKAYDDIATVDREMPKDAPVLHLFTG